MSAKRRIRRRRVVAAPQVRRSVEAGQRGKSEGDSGLMVGGAHDPAEHAADRMAAQAMSAGVAGKSATGGAALRREVEKPEDDKTAQRAAAAAPSVAPGAASAPAPKSAARAVAALGTGRPLSPSERGFYEPRFGRDFSAVRLHEGPSANRAAHALDARAFTQGDDIALADGAKTQATMAHELAHVASESPTALRRDLAVEPSNPGAVAAVLTPAERAAAQSFNERRFEDPFTISVVRDVMGVSKYPAVIDNEFIDGLVGWQAEHGLDQDGQFGPATTRTFIAELTGEGMAALVTQLRRDNSVSMTTTLPRVYPGAPAGAAAGTAFIGFDWDVAFATSLRNGFIVQHVQSVRNENPAAPGFVPAAPNYWEAWPVDGAGRITHPKHPSGGDDKWRRVIHNNSAGNWSVTGTLYTVLNLPAQFDAPGGANHAAAAGGLRSALNLSAANIDSLGLPEGFAPIQQGDERARRAAGTWDFTHANAALNFNRPA